MNAERQRATVLLAAAATQDRELVARLRQLLAELELVAAGTTPGYQPRSTSGAGTRPPVTGDPFPPALELVARIADAQTLDDLAAAAEWAQRELDAQRRGPRVAVKDETPTQRARRIVASGEGWPAYEVSRTLNVPLREVHAARADARVDPAFGRPWPEQPKRLRGEQRAARVRELHGQGMPYVRIAALLGVSTSTVRRDAGVK